MAMKPNWNEVPCLFAVKFVCAGMLIYVVWDLPHDRFNSLFFWLSTRAVPGAPGGTLYEWYFRTSLDHYCVLWGMLSASLLPYISRNLAWVEELPTAKQWLYKAAFGTPLLVSGIWYMLAVFPCSIQEYNLWHPYVSIIPIFSFIFLRNLVPQLRGYYLGLMQKLGSITLETYVLQFHIWLTTYGKGVLTVLPGHHPFNMLIAGVLLILVSQLAHHATAKLREIVLPESGWECVTNLSALGAAFSLAFVQALSLQQRGPMIMNIIMTCCVVGSAVSITVLQRCLVGSSARIHLIAMVSAVAFITANIQWLTRIAGVHLSGKVPTCLQDGLSWKSASICRRRPACSTASAWFEQLLPRDGMYGSSSLQACCDWAAAGNWQPPGRCPNRTLKSQSCGMPIWIWGNLPSRCHLQAEDLRRTACRRGLVFAGDSVVRETYFATRSLLSTNEFAHHGLHKQNASLKHKDIHSKVASCGQQLSFLWRPMVQDLVSTARATNLSNVTLVFGGGLWDALHTRDVEVYRLGLKALRKALSERSGISAFLRTTAVYDKLLLTAEKRQFMTDRLVASYRATSDAVLRPEEVQTVDGYALTLPVRHLSLDGVHYPSSVNVVLAAAVLRKLAVTMPKQQTFGRTTKFPRGREQPIRGFVVLILFVAAAVMAGMKRCNA